MLDFWRWDYFFTAVITLAIHDVFYFVKSRWSHE